MSFKKVAFVFVAFGIGYYTSRMSSVNTTVSRNPAAVRKSFDLTNLKGNALDIASKNTLLEGIQIAKQNWGLEMQLGHFVFARNSEESQACDEYSQVVIVFEGGGSGVNGEPAQLTVTADCVASRDLSKIEAIKIPLNFVYNEKPEDTEIDLRENYKVHLKLLNISDAWPRQWNLVEIRLQDPVSNQNMFIGRADIQNFLGHPLVISY
ncbi:MAG: hypothetical protein ACK5WZ_00450 [Pseudobdellovibrionaceae bacterium]